MRKITIVIAALFFLLTAFPSQVSKAQYADGLETDELFEHRLRELEKKAAKADRLLAKLMESPLADPKNNEVNVFSLKNVSAQSVAETIQRLYGSSGYRLSVEKATNRLIISASRETTLKFLDLLEKLDRSAEKKEQKAQPSQNDNSLPESLLVHTFWLADGLPANEGRDPNVLLPKNVLAALEKIGLEAPRIVSQSTSSLISHVEEENHFGSNMMATLNGQAMRFNNHGQLQRDAQGQVQIRMATSISRSVYDYSAGGGRRKVNSKECEIEGSLSSPLGHFMVLGTANYVSQKETPQNDRAKRGGGGGGEYGGGFGGQLGGMEKGKATSPQPELTTARFAFVIQVVENEFFEQDGK